jgi:hypothetical protein
MELTTSSESKYSVTRNVRKTELTASRIIVPKASERKEGEGGAWKYQGNDRKQIIILRMIPFTAVIKLANKSTNINSSSRTIPFLHQTQALLTDQHRAA